MRKTRISLVVPLATLLGLAACKERAKTDTESDPNAVDLEDPSVIGAIEESVSLDDLQKWKTYLTAAEQDPEKIKVEINKAAKEFKVPAEILMAMAQVETNFTHIGPSIDRGWGIMHLVENHYSDTLGKAAELLKVSRDELKNNMRQNIRGMAALIANAAGDKAKTFKKPEDWFDAVKVATGLDGAGLQAEQAVRYYDVMKSGVTARTIFEKTVTLPTNKNINLPAALRAEPEAAQKAEYPKAEADYIPCNYTEGRKGQKVDTWVNHYIAVGSVAGARSWFKNCKAKSSAHFLITKEGKVYQFRPSTDTTWHAGAKYNPKGFPHNNHRSIGVEHEVLLTHPEWWQRPELLKSSVELAHFYAKKYNIPKKHVKGDNTQPGVRGHQEMPATKTACPGPLPWDKWWSMFTALK